MSITTDRRGPDPGRDDRPARSPERRRRSDRRTPPRDLRMRSTPTSASTWPSSPAQAATFCAGADLKAIGEGSGNRIEEDISRPGPLGCTRMLLSKPVIAAVEGHAVAGRPRARAVVRPPGRRDRRDVRRLLPAVGRAVGRRWNGPPAPAHRSEPRPRHDPHRPRRRAATRPATGAWPTGCARPAMRSTEAVALAESLSAFPQLCLRTDRRSSYEQWGLPLDDALRQRDAARADPGPRGRDARWRGALRRRRRPPRRRGLTVP